MISFIGNTQGWHHFCSYQYKNGGSEFMSTMQMADGRIRNKLHFCYQIRGESNDKINRGPGFGPGIDWALAKDLVPLFHPPSRYWIYVSCLLNHSPRPFPAARAVSFHVIQNAFLSDSVTTKWDSVASSHMYSLTQQRVFSILYR